MNKFNKRILLTNAGTTVAQNILDYNIESGLDFYGVDMNSFCYAAKILGKKFFVVPSSKDWQKYKMSLLKICRDNKINLIISCSNDEELLKLTKDRKDFEAIGTKILASDYKIIKLCDDKIMCATAVAKLGIKTVPIYLPNSIFSHSKFPLFVKLRRGGGSSIAKIIKNVADLKYFVKTFKGVIFQPFIKGQEYSLDMVLDNKSEVIVCSCRKRVAVKAGVCVKTEIVENKKLYKQAALIAKELKLIGGVNIQFIDDYFIEVNPRLPAGLGLVSKVGFNMSLLAIKSFFNQPIDEQEKKFKKSKILRIWTDVIYEE